MPAEHWAQAWPWGQWKDLWCREQKSEGNQPWCPKTAVLRPKNPIMFFSWLLSSPPQELIQWPSESLRVGYPDTGTWRVPAAPKKQTCRSGIVWEPWGASFKWNRHLTLDKQLQWLHGLSQAFIADTESWHWQPLLERYQAAAAASQMPTYGDTAGNEQDEAWWSCPGPASPEWGRGCREAGLEGNDTIKGVRCHYLTLCLPISPGFPL